MCLNKTYLHDFIFSYKHINELKKILSFMSSSNCISNNFEYITGALHNFKIMLEDK